MPHVLHLFNVFGALTERAMLDYTLGLAKQFPLSVACESVAPECPPTGLPVTLFQRVHVEPTADVDAQMTQLAQHVDDPACRLALGEPFDLLHGHFGPRILHAAPWLLRGVPVIVSTYGYDVGRLCRDPSWVARYRWAADRGATFVALARFMEQRLLDFGLPRERVRRIHLGIDLDQHAFEPSPAPATPRFVFVGRFVDKKGADVLLDALAILKQQGVPVTLDLIGGGPNEPALRAQAARLALHDRARFLGFVPFAQLFDHLRGCTAMVQPSQTAPDGDAEGAPMVLMSAQACGVPCITTRHSGNPETIPPEGQPFVVPERDAESLAEAMWRMASLPQGDRAVLQDAGRAWIARHFNLAQTEAQYAALYEELMGGGTR